MGPIFIILGPMEGIHIPADGLPRDYELLRGNGASDASRRHRRSLLGIILVILHNNIIFEGLCGYIMRCCDTPMTKYQRTAVNWNSNPEIIYLCDECERVILGDEGELDD